MKNRIHSVLAAGLLLGAVIFAGCGQQKEQMEKENSAEKIVSEQASSEGQESDEKSAANGLMGTFQTTDWEGNAVDQDIFTQSDLTMLNIWGSFCGPCISEMPYLGELSREYEGKMQIIGLISDVSQPDDGYVKSIIEATGADYTHILVSQDMINGYMKEVQAVPTTIFLDKEGNEQGIYTGTRDKDTWKSVIDEMLEKVSDKGNAE